MARKKRAAALPRVTVMAYSRRDLAAFVLAVEQLGIIRDDLRVILNQMQKPKRQKTTSQDALQSPNGIAADHNYTPKSAGD